MSEQAKPRRAKHVASSARILATGLSATAVLGLTSALALAKPAWEANVDSVDPVASSAHADTILMVGGPTPASTTIPPLQSAAATPVAVQQTAAPTTSNSPAKSPTKNSAPQAPSTTAAPAPATSQAPVVVTVPVPPTSGGNTGGNSKSNGS